MEKIKIYIKMFYKIYLFNYKVFKNSNHIL